LFTEDANLRIYVADAIQHRHFESTGCSRRVTNGKRTLPGVIHFRQQSQIVELSHRDFIISKS